MIGYAHGAGWEADDRQGNRVGPGDGAGLFPWPRTVAVCVAEAPLCQVGADGAGAVR